MLSFASTISWRVMEDSSKASYAWSTAEVACSGGEGAMKLRVVELRDKVKTKKLGAFIDFWNVRRQQCV
jgi:hypothetical protein